MSMTTDLKESIGHKLLLGFNGTSAPPEVLTWIRNRTVGGFTLFRYRNVENPYQVRQLTAVLQQTAAESGQPPLLLAADQEGGQLMGLGNGLTPFPGNMALGATGSLDLAYAVGHAIGLECAALGINMNYAPSCDVNSNPQNPVIGVRSFGEDANMVADFAATITRGMQDAGIFTVPKHFPGHGDTQSDSHHGIPVLAHDLERLWDVELRPFQAVIEAGSKLIMSAHVGIPALNDGQVMPATVSRAILHDLLRVRMGFKGVIVSDAMDMGAIQQGTDMAEDIIKAANAGLDLLLMTHDTAAQELAYKTLADSIQTGTIAQKNLKDSIDRILQLKSWLRERPQPGLDVVRSEEHLALAQKVANQAVTLVRNAANLLPLQLDTTQHIAVIMPEFKVLTPADTSVSEKQTLANALRQYHPNVDEFVVPHLPDDSTISIFRSRVKQYDLIIIGTIEASRQQEQANLVNVLLETGVPVIPVAMRTPYDLAAYSNAQTYICTYSIQKPAMDALAAALFGKIPFMGRLPTQIPGLYPIGFALSGE